MPKKAFYLEADPLWYKDAIIYELHVKTFYDSNNDGIGDFKGLIQKLDYLEDLGITAIWLLPFYSSPLKDDGYDIADYFNVHKNYGGLKDFKDFLREAHRRGIRVITELVLNHTSDQHAWFQKSRRAKAGSSWRNYYVWNDTPEKYQDARIIFKDFESSNWSWDTVARQYFWHRFYSHQPDLNYESTHLQKAVSRVLDFWLEMGVDGLRLDAVPYLFESEGTHCENLTETYEFLKKLRKHIDGKFKNIMLLAEANQWPEDAAAYFGNGDICHLAFHFPLMPRMFMALQMEDRFPVIDILEQTPSIPENCQWAMFLRNHDELTLEMVTDEERDYMYRIYARDAVARINLGIRRRLAPLLGNNRRKIELMNVLLFTLPGTPVIYYGDEIGMGDNYYLGDRDGVRTPMQWSGDRNAGFSRANPHKLYLPVIMDPGYHFEAVNVESQQLSTASLLWWMKHSIAMRKRFKCFGRGSIEFITPDNPKVLAYIRRYEDENILVVVNLSKYAQVAEMDLSKLQGYIPEDVFSGNKFPVIKDDPYIFTLSPHGYYIFMLRQEEVLVVEKETLPEIRVSENWEKIFEGKTRERLERRILPQYLKQRRWFGGKARTIRQVSIEENIRVPENGSYISLLFIEVKYSEGPPEVYMLPVSFTSHRGVEGDTEQFITEGVTLKLDYEWLKLKVDRIMEESPQAVIARLNVDNEEGIIYDSMYTSKFRDKIFEMLSRRKKIKGTTGEITAIPGKMFRKLMGDRKHFNSRVLMAEQSNTSILYEDVFFFKLFRKISEGLNPDMELVRFLTEKAKFRNIPPFAGAVEFRRRGGEPGTVGLLQGFIPNQGDTWTYTLDSVKHYFEHVLAKKHELIKTPVTCEKFLNIESCEIPNVLNELIGGVYFEMVRLLGVRTAELHMALSSAPDIPDFAPEPFSLLYQRSVYQAMRSLTRKVFQSLSKNLKKLPGHIMDEGTKILSLEKNIITSFGSITKEKIPVTKTRIHGDYHLGQVLYTGKDFIIIDFEGEPARALSERRLKRSPLVDVAGMLRSFHYAAYSAYLHHVEVRPEDSAELESWIEPWYNSVGRIFLQSYLTTAKDAAFLPKKKDHLKTLLQVYLLDKAVYEIGYELNNRPAWLLIPFKGIENVLGGEK